VGTAIVGAPFPKVKPARLAPPTRTGPEPCSHEKPPAAGPGVGSSIQANVRSQALSSSSRPSPQTPHQSHRRPRHPRPKASPQQSTPAHHRPPRRPSPLRPHTRPCPVPSTHSQAP